MRFSELGEFGFIERISEHGVVREEGVLCGIGDDCAVFSLGAGRALLVTTDLMVEEVHFLTGASAPEGLGYKLLAVNLSDIAAMGGTPRDAVVSVAIPGDFDVGYVERIYDGLHAYGSLSKVNISGGDTTRSPGPLVLNLMLIGEMPEDQICYRSGAKPGDLIYVSGTLGDSAAGLELVRGLDIEIPLEHRSALLKRHHRPQPRVELGQRLAASGVVTAMIDLSDGVASDLRHICSQSEVAAVILSDGIPLSPACEAFGEATETDVLSKALSGGEDYELLFTVKPEGVERVRSLEEKTGTPPLSQIGRIEEGRDQLHLEDADGRRELEEAGFDHFKQTDVSRGA